MSLRVREVCVPIELHLCRYPHVPSHPSLPISSLRGLPHDYLVCWYSHDCPRLATIAASLPILIYAVHWAQITFRASLTFVSAEHQQRSTHYEIGELPGVRSLYNLVALVVDFGNYIEHVAEMLAELPI